MQILIFDMYVYILNDNKCLNNYSYFFFFTKYNSTIAEGREREKERMREN